MAEATGGAHADPRDLVERQIGSKARDGAVDPLPKDFMGPTNAGLPGEAGNPHGPNVVSPGIHASGEFAVVPGPTLPVSHQESKETEFAERAIAGNDEVPAVLADLAPPAKGSEPEDDDAPKGKAKRKASKNT